MDTTEYFLYILKCFYKKTECIPPESKIDNKELYTLSKSHDVVGIMYYKLHDLDFLKNSELCSQFRKGFFVSSADGIMTENNIKVLTGTLNKEKIPHFLFKGAVTRKTYPIAEMRTMGDVDIYINEKYFEKAIKSLTENGFKKDNSHAHPNVKVLTYSNTQFELHSCIASRNCDMNSFDFVEFFKSCEEHKMLISDCTYTFEPTYHLLFLLFHLLKHFECKGCGIRLFLDIPFFTDHYKDEIDFNLLNKYLKETKLFDFADSVYSFCAEKFGSDLPRIFTGNLNKEEMRKFTGRIIRAGTFGRLANESAGEKILRTQLLSGYEDQKHRYIKSIGKLMFPSREQLYYHGFIDNKEISAAHIPAAYIKRFHYLIFKRKDTGKFLKDMVKNDGTAADLEFIKKIGIYQK